MGIFKHISPEYYISDGLGNRASTYQIVEGNSNSIKGNGGTWTPNIVAHIQYYSTNMLVICFHSVITLQLTDD